MANGQTFDKAHPADSSRLVKSRPCIFFTAFEPSGDEHAASVIAELRRLLPDVPLYGLGGPRMAEAGCEIIEQTSGVGRMLADSAWQVADHFKRLARVKKWCKTQSIAVHIPTDSPAANWSYCRMIKHIYARPRGGKPASRVVHLVAPQVWAWAQWRVRRLQKWSDLVLCLLPFEPAWFRARGVSAKFIGHPAFDYDLDTDKLNWQAVQFPKGSPRIALLPGSRPTELKRNWPVLHDAFTRMLKQYPDAQAVVGAVDAEAEKTLRAMTPHTPESIYFAHGRTHAVLHWADAVLSVSGTVTLHVARHGKPMAIIYKASPVAWHMFGRFLIDTRTFTLPNLIALGRAMPTDEQHIVKEFIPFWGDVQPLADEMSSLISDQKKRGTQIAELKKVIGKFTDHHAGREAAQQIAEQYRKATRP